MSIVTSRRACRARFAVCVCAIVCGCGKPEASSPVDTARNSDLPAATSTSELEEWAKQAAGGAATAQPAIAKAASEPLATPVIHTVD